VSRAVEIGLAAQPLRAGARALSRPRAANSSKNGSKDVAKNAVRNGHRELRLWLRLLHCSARIEKQLQARLKQEFNTSLSCFDALAQLDRFSAGLSMTDLSQHLMVSNGAITGLIGKLIAAELVQRSASPDDQRTSIVRLTSRGRQHFRAMAVRHETWLKSMIGELGAEPQAELFSGLSALKSHLDYHEA
jgi:DNA-binding MarR family transcriptional regulator